VPFLSAFEVFHDDALYKSTFTLLYLLTTTHLVAEVCSSIEDMAVAVMCKPTFQWCPLQ